MRQNTILQGIQPENLIVRFPHSLHIDLSGKVIPVHHGQAERRMCAGIHLLGSYHRVLCLYRFDLQAVLHASGGAVAFQLVFQASCTLLGTGLILPILTGGMGAGGQIVALLLGDMCFGAMDGLHVLPERTGVCVALGASGDLTHVRFLYRQTSREFTIMETLRCQYLFHNCLQQYGEPGKGHLMSGHYRALVLTHTYSHMHTHTHTPTCILTHAKSHMHSHTHTHTHIHMHRHALHTLMQNYTHILIHIFIYTHPRTHTHFTITCILPYAYSHTQTHICILIHTYSCIKGNLGTSSFWF